jgi:hypothetical protein
MHNASLSKKVAKMGLLVVGQGLVQLSQIPSEEFDG